MLVIPILFLSGSYAPVEAMPARQNYLTLLSPQRYYLELGYGILLKGASFASLWRDFPGLSFVVVSSSEWVCAGSSGRLGSLFSTVVLTIP